MIERERLQELIEKEEVIWSVSPYNEAFEMWLTGDVKIRDDCALQFGSSYIETYMISDLYETQAEAEWVAKMHTQRTDFFEPPVWEEFEKQGEPYYFIGKGGIKERIYIYNNNGRRKLLSSGCKFWGTPTKDNYIKACEYARNLFLGKENEDD